MIETQKAHEGMQLWPPAHPIPQLPGPSSDGNQCYNFLCIMKDFKYICKILCLLWIYVHTHTSTRAHTRVFRVDSERDF